MFFKKEKVLLKLTHVKYPLVIMDFDGVICNSFKTMINAVNAFSEKYGYKEASAKNINHLKELSSIEVFNTLGMKTYKLPFILKSVRNYLTDRISEMASFEGIENFLQVLKSNDASLVILTSNSLRNVELFLEQEKLKYFDAIFSTNTIFGKDRTLKKIVRSLPGTPNKERIFYVGDETRDINAAQKANIQPIGVTWGYNSKSALKKASPAFICDSMVDLLNVLLTTNNKA